MITEDQLRTYALSFPDAEEEPHFEKTSFRIKKKIFLTYDHSRHQACVKLNAEQQDHLCSAAGTSIFPVPNKWGKQGWTMIELSDVPAPLFEKAIKTSVELLSEKRK
jgi:predicted DNA-binding protein (MmcQ/YjbR family)